MRARRWVFGTAFVLGVVAACHPLPNLDDDKGSGGEITPSPGTPPTGITPSGSARTLFTNPTPDAIAAANSEHTPTDREIAEVAVFWSFLIVSQTSGELDPFLFQSGVYDQVVAIAAEYPSYFSTTAPGSFTTRAWHVEALTCGSSCNTPIDVLAIASTAAQVIAAVALKDKAAAIYKTVAGLEKNLAGVIGDTASTVADAISHDDALALLIDVGKVAAGGIALAGVGGATGAIAGVFGLLTTVGDSLADWETSKLQAKDCALFHDSSCCGTVARPPGGSCCSGTACAGSCISCETTMHCVPANFTGVCCGDEACDSGRCTVDGTACARCPGGESFCAETCCPNGQCKDGTCQCGSPGELCCAVGDACLSTVSGLGDATCDEGRCSACGDDGQPCCDGNTCSASGLGIECFSGTCETCGQASLQCCPGDTCLDGSHCSSGFCTADATQCGQRGSPCCPGDGCSSEFSSSGECIAGYCQACGAWGEPCCPLNPCWHEPGNAVCVDDICMRCGSAGEPCCPGDQCAGGDTVCAGGICAVTGDGADGGAPDAGH